MARSLSVHDEQLLADCSIQLDRVTV